MKLSTLVAYRSLLTNYTPQDTHVVVNGVAGHSLHVVQEHAIQFPALTKQLSQAYGNINQAFADYRLAIDDIQEKIQELIEDAEPEYFRESYRLYEQEFAKDNIDYILDRRLELSEDAANYVQARIKGHGDWHYPAMIIRPGREDWINDLVACDPLYLLDQDPALLTPARSRFNELYQGRLRTYTIRQEDDRPAAQMPDAQIGFCLVYNYFNYKPFEILKSYLTDIYTKLRPGGTLAFTFNDCDRSGAVQLVERSFMCYTPGSLVMALCENVGFDIAQIYKVDAACSWIELRKPGTLSSLRGGQNIAKVVAKSK